MAEQDYREACDSFVESHMGDVWDLSLYVHEHPELGYEEHEACRVQCDWLEAQGFEVTRGVDELDTAFVATWGSGSPVIAVASEYDALKGLGHGCGHNLICATSIMMGAAVRSWLEETGTPGTVKVIGTPAEEGGGGKIRLLEKGVFDGLDAVFMMHPTSDKTRIAGECMSVGTMDFKFEGEKAQAGSHPDRGRNALSAASLFLNAVGLWRQHLTYDMRVSMIMTEGGEAANIIPASISLHGDVRALKVSDLRWLGKTIGECAEHCAAALGCKATYSFTEGYLGRVPNEVLGEVCRREFVDLGEQMLPGMPADFGGEDLGNVSMRVPVCSPYMTIFPDYKISGHTEQFRKLAGGKNGRHCIERASKAMARSIAWLFCHEETLSEARAELDRRLEKSV